MAAFLTFLHNFLDILLKGGGLTVLVLVGKLVASKIPENTKIPDGHATAAVILSTAVDAFERLVKGFLTGPYLEQILTAVAAGTPLPLALSAQMPAMLAALRTAIGPQATAILTAVFGADGEKTQLEGVIVAAVHALIDGRTPATTATPASASAPPAPPALPTTPAVAPTPALSAVSVTTPASGVA